MVGFLPKNLINEFAQQAVSEVGDSIIQAADTNNDGKISIVEMFNLILKNPIFIFVAVIIITLSPLLDFILAGITTSSWDWNSLFSTLASSVIALLFYLIMKGTDKEYRGLICSLKENFDKRVESYKLKSNDLSNENQKLKEENAQIKLALELKKQFIEMELKRQ